MGEIQLQIRGLISTLTKQDQENVWIAYNDLKVKLASNENYAIAIALIGAELAEQ